MARMVVLTLLSFGLLLAAGQISRLARRIVSAVVVILGMAIAAVGAINGDVIGDVLAGAALMSGGSAGLLMGAIPRRIAVGFLAMIGLPWLLVLWMGIRLNGVPSAPEGARAALLVSAGLLVLFAALGLEQAGQSRGVQPNGSSSGP